MPTSENSNDDELCAILLCILCS